MLPIFRLKDSWISLRDWVSLKLLVVVVGIASVAGERASFSGSLSNRSIWMLFSPELAAGDVRCGGKAKVTCLLTLAAENTSSLGVKDLLAPARVKGLGSVVKELLMPVFESILGFESTKVLRVLLNSQELLRLDCLDIRLPDP